MYVRARQAARATARDGASAWASRTTKTPPEDPEVRRPRAENPRIRDISQCDVCSSRYFIFAAEYGLSCKLRFPLYICLHMCMQYEATYGTYVAPRTARLHVGIWSTYSVAQRRTHTPGGKAWSLAVITRTPLGVVKSQRRGRHPHRTRSRRLRCTRPASCGSVRTPSPLSPG